MKFLSIHAVLKFRRDVHRHGIESPKNAVSMRLYVEQNRSIILKMMNAKII